MTSSSSHSVAWVAGHTQYKFRVTACNGCGCSKSCAPLNVRRVTVPHACECPTVTNDQCRFVNPTTTMPQMVSIAWKRPANDGGSPISEYKVEVQMVNGLWHDVSTGCSPYTLTRHVKCIIEQKVLAAIGITAGVEIKARVFSKNQAGWSHPTPNCLNNVVVALKMPTNMPHPQITQMIHGSFKVCYMAHHQASEYALSWHSTTLTRQVRQISASKMINGQNCELITNLHPGIKTTICIRSDTSC
jgi:hypothetical protein